MRTNDKITIAVAGKTREIIYPSYQLVTQHTVDALAHIGESVTGRLTRDWRLVDTKGHNGTFRIKLAAPMAVYDAGHKIHAAFILGIRDLEHGRTAELPAQFTIEALKSVRRSLSVYNDGVAAMWFSSGDEEVAPTPLVVKTISRILAGVRHRHTTVRGRLFRVTVEDENSSTWRVGLEQDHTNKRITCKIPTAFADIAKSNLNNRVALSGRVAYSPDDVPVAMEVSAIRPLEPIPYSDIPPLKLVDDDDDPGDFVRRLRDAQ